MKTTEIRNIIIATVREGKTHTLSKNSEVIRFLLEISIKKAMYWADKIDNNFDIWKLVLVNRKVSCKQILECAERYHNSIIWALALDRVDVQKRLLKMSTQEAIAYAEINEREELWEFTLKQTNVAEHFKGFSKLEASAYANKINHNEVYKFFGGKCLVCGKSTYDNPFYTGENPICSQECLREWDDDHPNLDEEQEI